jgi:GNAT superfamily N-acetyltransferase
MRVTAMGTQYVYDYKYNDKLRLSFNELAKSTFGIDFESWYRLGFWDDRYICHSFEDNGRIVANISASMMDIVLYGKKIKAIQIGTVMTHPGYRRKGLAGMLMEIVIREYEDKCGSMFLFGLNELHDFYTRFGYAPVNETRFYTNVLPACDFSCITRKLSMSDKDDASIITKLFSGKVPVSDAFRAENDDSIFRWHCLNDLRNDIYFIQDPDTVVICRADGNVLDIFDVVSHDVPDIRRIIGIFGANNICETIFHYTPGLVNVTIKEKLVTDEDYTFFIRPVTAGLQDRLFFPCTSRT